MTVGRWRTRRHDRRLGPSFRRRKVAALAADGERPATVNREVRPSSRHCANPFEGSSPSGEAPTKRAPVDDRESLDAVSCSSAEKEHRFRHAGSPSSSSDPVDRQLDPSFRRHKAPRRRPRHPSTRGFVESPEEVHCSTDAATSARNHSSTKNTP